MADIAKVSNQVGVHRPLDSIILPMIAGEAISKGDALYVIAASGLVGKADANSANKQQFRGIALNDAQSGQAVSVLKEGFVSGFTITQAYDTPVFLSDVEGQLADAAGTLSVPVGLVMAISDYPTSSKLIYIEARYKEDYA